jgi:glycosyltransferase involved in cell wall biosynthesis
LKWVFYYLATKDFSLKKIIISVSNDLTTDQRVEKISNTLISNNYELLLIGRKLKSSIPISRKYEVRRIKLLFNKGFLFYAEFNIRLFFKLLFLKKDLLISNDLDTLLPNYLVSKLQSKKIIYDSHELFTEIPELVHRPHVKNIWAKLERHILPKLNNCYTVSNSIADYYTNKYNTSFSTIRNLPTVKNTVPGVFPFPTNGKKVILYQGTINIGRGLELMIETMNHLDNHIFVIIGTGDIIEDLKKKNIELITDNTIYFLGKLLPSEMQKLTPLADVGISLEEDLGLNYRYALPNKIFDYLHAEIPVLVSDLPEMKNIIDTYQFGEIATNRDPKLLARQIENLLKNDFSSAIKAAKQKLTWENEKEKLIDLFNNLH